MKWLVVAVILAYIGLRVTIALRPSAPLSRFVRRRVVLRTDVDEMSRRELILSAASFLVFAICGVALSLGIGRAGAELGWAVFFSRPVVVLGKAALFVGALAAATGLFLAAVAVLRRDRS